jgi:hypothetical protein
METGPLPEATKPSSRPPSYWTWLSSQFCAGLLARGRHPEGVLDAAVRVRIPRPGQLAWADPEAVGTRAAQHAEVVVVGVVLHHHHDDVLDLADRVGALGQPRVGQRPRPPEPGPARRRRAAS